MYHLSKKEYNYSDIQSMSEKTITTSENSNSATKLNFIQKGIKIKHLPA
jgi:hypothetical protein